MKTPFSRFLPPVALTLALCLFATTQSDAKDELISHELDGISKLNFEITRANITLTGSDRDDLELRLKKPAFGFDPEHIERTIERQGETLVIKIEYTKANKGWWSSDNKGYSAAELLIPHSLVAKIRTSGGNIEATSIDAPLTLKTSGGNISASKIAGPIEVDTSGGNIVLKQIDGDTDAHTSGGNITVDGIAGKASINTSGGNIAISGAITALRAKTSGGYIDASIDSAVVEPLELRSSGGNVSAILKAGLDAPADLSTSGGNVSITLPRQQGFSLKAKSNGGHVSLNHSGQFKGELGKKKVEGDINGGGPDIKLKTSGGRVNVSEI